MDTSPEGENVDPKNIKLRASQKIVPMLKAINEEIPWQLILISAIAITAWVIVPTYMPVFFATEPMADLIVRRFLVGFVVAVITFFACGFTYMVIDDKLMPLFRKIKENYEKETLKVKKEVLDNVIEDEILIKDE
jgi:H+/gluconate symporter-like permease